MNYPYTQLPGPPSFPRSGGRFAVPGLVEVTVLPLLLYLVATVLLTLAAFGITLPRVHLGWLGLAIIAFTAMVLPAV